MLHHREKHPSARFRQDEETVVLWLQCVTAPVFVSLLNLFFQLISSWDTFKQ